MACGKKKLKHLTEFTRAFCFMVAKVCQLAPFDLGCPNEQGSCYKADNSDIIIKTSFRV